MNKKLHSNRKDNLETAPLVRNMFEMCVFDLLFSLWKACFGCFESQMLLKCGICYNIEDCAHSGIHTWRYDRYTLCFCCALGTAQVQLTCWLTCSTNQQHRSCEVQTFIGNNLDKSKWLTFLMRLKHYEPEQKYVI